MSGRSAYVRKEKTKIKDIGPTLHIGSENSGSIPDFPVAMSSGPNMAFQHAVPMRSHPHGESATVKSGASNGSDEQRGYARVQKPILPMIIDSGIEKSTFRSLMDKKSEGVRKGLAKTFGGKKKKEENRPDTSTTIRPTDHYELDSGSFVDPGMYSPPPTYAKPRTPHSISSGGYADTEYSRPGTGPRTAPPQSKLPPIPQGPQMKRWIGGNRPAQPWNKLRKDPELWDPNGDTLIYFGRSDSYGPKPAPSFRISSHIIERTESRKLMMLLRQGSTDDQSHGFSMPPSPLSSPGTTPAYPVRHRNYHQTPPISENSSRGFEGQISYELFFEPEKDKSPAEIIRHQVTTRNFFALLSEKSLAGLNLFQALNDLTERLEEWMPHDTDAAGMVIDYMVGKGFDDMRDNPSAAASILAWSELQNVWWDEGWIEGFVHCCGMYDRIEHTPDFRFVSSITRAHLERSACEMQVRVHDAENRLNDFDFGDMWPAMSSQSPPARASFDKARNFFLDFYRRTEGGWPPLPPPADDQWLTRTWAQKLQTDFGALYDYLVDRVVVWDGSEERSGRKWNIVRRGDRAFDADTPDLPFTDLLVAFDNRHAFPHIPRPYCLVPSHTSSEGHSTPAKKGPKSIPDKMAETKARLAYTNSTNVFALGSSFPRNELVEEFTKFEKADFTTSDPYAARRGHWVMIYGILQILASISVDSPNLRYWDGISYHLSPKLRDTPPWRKDSSPPEAGHTLSHCWLAVDRWSPKPSSFNFNANLPILQTQPLNISSTRRSPSSAGSEGPSSSFKKSSFSPAKGAGPGTSTTSKRRNVRDSDKSDADFNLNMNMNTSFTSTSTSTSSRGDHHLPAHPSTHQTQSRYADPQSQSPLGSPPYLHSHSTTTTHAHINTTMPPERQDPHPHPHPHPHPSPSPSALYSLTPRTGSPLTSTSTTPPYPYPSRHVHSSRLNTGTGPITTTAANPNPLSISTTGYAPGIEKVGDLDLDLDLGLDLGRERAWPIRESSHTNLKAGTAARSSPERHAVAAGAGAGAGLRSRNGPFAARQMMDNTGSAAAAAGAGGMGRSASPEENDRPVPVRLHSSRDRERGGNGAGEGRMGGGGGANVQKIRENLELGREGRSRGLDRDRVGERERKDERFVIKDFDFE